jgi:acyl-CoA dehydrogenase
MEKPLALDVPPAVRPLTTLSARAQAAAAIAAKHATRVDEESTFPLEAIDTIKEQRLLGILVPRALGGDGAGIRDAADVCYRLGQSCASTAMIYAMHSVKVACLVRHHGGNAALEQLLRRLCEEQLLLASSTTEGQGGGNVRSSEAAVQRQDGSITLRRVASVISYGAYADGIVTTARRSDDAPGSDQQLVAFLKSDYTLTRIQGWSTLGMRGTCSEGYTLEARGVEDQILPEGYETIHAQTMVPFSHLLWGSVWAGIAAGATQRAQAFIRQAIRGSGGQPPPGAAQFTKALSSLRTLRALLSSVMLSYENAMSEPARLMALEFQSMISLTKVEASESAVAIVMLALRACGLSGYRRDGNFSVERHLRDVLSAPLMINNERILANSMNTSFLTPVPQALSE